MNIYLSLNTVVEIGNTGTTYYKIEFEDNHFYEFNDDEWNILPSCYKLVDGEPQEIDTERIGVVKLEPSHLNKYMLIVK